MSYSNYGGLIETMYGQFPLEEIPENIKKYKERIDSLFSCNSRSELKEKLKTFSKKERNYLNSKLLDEFFKIYDLNFTHIKDEYLNYFLFSQGSKYGCINIVNIMLEKNIDAGLWRNSPIRYASENGHLDVVNRLLETKKCDIHDVDDYALRYASKNGHTAIVNILLENGADIHANEDEAFRCALYNNHKEIVNILEKAGSKYIIPYK